MPLRITLGFLLVCLAPFASAHDLWIERNSGGYVLYNGHLHSGHGGAKTIPYAPSFVQQASCFDTDGRVVERQAGGSPFRLEGACAVLLVTASSGYWSKTPFETINLPKSEVGQVVRSWRSVESVKRIDQWRERFAAPLGDALEIVPRENPLEASSGDKLHLFVSFNGEPVEGAVVSYDGHARGATDAKGMINIRLRHSGFQLVAASLTRPLNSSDADEEIHTAVLNFELPQ